MKNSQTGSLALVVALVVAVLVVGGVSYYLLRNRQTVVAPTPTAISQRSTPLSSAPIRPPSAAPVTFTGTRLAGTTTPLLDFNQTDYQAALAADKLIVVYFYASWCPICQAEFPLMQAAFNQLALPNVVGFRVNYNDDATDEFEKNLAREHGVAYQHTKVFVKNGQRISKSPETWTQARYVADITAAAR